MSDVVVSLIRTWCPIVVGAVLAWVASRGLDLSPSTDAAVVAAITGGITAVWYSLARLLEAKWSWLGVLLGYPGQPVYTKPTKA